ncbi:MAG: nucleotidyltransferase domain-containing protein, partial [Aquabacterium sp.]|nr:nucleotidyltransferase domain-containing protein [Aquabacterium sp.]
MSNEALPAPLSPASPASAELDLAALRAQFRDGKRALIEHFMQGRASAPAATRLIRALTRHVDATLALLWSHCALPANAALVAVGGYGRGELLPYSDIDVLLLLPEEAEVQAGSALKAAIESFITACWDIGLEIGSSVRTVAECVLEARGDQTVQTALLESRLVCGARKLCAAFQRETAALMDAKAFLRAKTLELQQRHTKYEDTPYALEPNCKESPGG